MQRTQEMRQISLSYVRAFVIVLVIAHHTGLAYTSFKIPRLPSFDSRPLLWTAFPVVNRIGWRGFDVLVQWNDIFFMALMFFVSGLFVWPSLRHRGTGDFLKRRFQRLGVPFLAAAAVLAPLAYYPAYLQFGANPHLSAYAKAWLSLGIWPAGPAWFLWVLLVFDCLATLCYVAASAIVEPFARVWRKASERPSLFYVSLVALSATAYVPFVRLVGPSRWSSFGPFFFQTSRILHYFVYFFAGMCAGAFGTDTPLFSITGKLARRWFLWVGFAIFAFIAELAAGISGKVLLAEMLFPVSCAASSLSLIAVFIRFARPNRILDSLSNNAYGIYLIHYVFVIWLQWALLQPAFPVIVKALVVFVGALGLSWITSIGLRRFPKVAQVM